MANEWEFVEFSRLHFLTKVMCCRTAMMVVLIYFVMPCHGLLRYIMSCLNNSPPPSPPTSYGDMGHSHMHMTTPPTPLKENAHNPFSILFQAKGI